MWTRSFLILHGADDRRSAAHWQHDLALRLRKAGEQVFYPQLPDPDRPSLDAWTEAVRAELAMMRGEKVVVCHSLACIAWLHVAAADGPAPAERVLLVSPPGPSALSEDALAGFSPESLDLSTLKLASSITRLVCSVDDPHCPEVAAEVYGRPLACEVDLLTEGGHLSADDGYGPWPSALEWCLDPSARLVARGA